VLEVLDDPKLKFDYGVLERAIVTENEQSKLFYIVLYNYLESEKFSAKSNK